ncbi:MAG: c-type cytochrome, partial [Candidatus Thiodiazotropha sp. (ex Lucinoma borealis)]|nr:c-type cytochrome [Candidatus Thiodiazotropha sp. (ex Lucinoma borealis)]
DQAFGEGENINIENIAKAIAAYERTLVTPNSPFDRYLRGDKKALSKQAIQGMETFAATGCISCHSGANFNGPSLPTGQGFFQKFPMFTNNEYVTKYGLMNDTGRMNVTGNETDKNLWRVPTLRNLTYTAPYMHTGAVKTLDEAVRVMAKTQLDKSLSNQAVEEILAFLDALNGEFPEQTMPRLPATPGNLLD